MTRQTLVFIPESGKATGMGHVYRLLSMAQMLDKDNDVRFLVQNEETVAVIKKNGYICFQIPFDTDSLVQQFSSGEIAVFDGYHFDPRLFSDLKSAETKTVFLDDFATNLPSADLILNTADLDTIPGKIDFSSQFAYGHQYILLRNAFLETAHFEREIAASPSKIFICLGATDPMNLTNSLIGLLSQLLPNASYQILSSSMNPQFDQLAALPQVKMVADAGSELIVQTLQNCGIAIVSASNIAQECIAVGVPLACIQTADNQEKLYNSLCDNQLCFALGNHLDFANSLETLVRHLTNTAYWRDQHLAQKNWIDGKSGIRIRQLVDSLQLTIRDVEKHDSDLLLNWKNDPVSLENSFNSMPVGKAEHEKWFENELNDKNAALYLIHFGEKPVCLVRFKKQHQNAVIGITIAPEYRGFRFAPRSLVIACKKYREEHTFKLIEAYIKEGNVASVRSFEAAGFRLQSKTTINSSPALLLTKTSTSD